MDWNEDLIWKAFEAAQKTRNDNDLAEALGITTYQLAQWKTAHAAFANAIEAGRAPHNAKIGAGNRLAAYLTQNLDPALRTLWDEIRATEDADARQRMLMEVSGGDVTKQRLLVYAMSATNFNIMRCCNLLGISKRQIDHWVRNDPDFPALLEEIEWSKKNFIESALMEKVARGSEKAIIAANQSINSDRGYGNQLKVSGQINHVVGVIDLDRLEMPLELRVQLLDTIRESGLIDMDGMLVSEDSPVVEAIAKNATINPTSPS